MLCLSVQDIVNTRAFEWFLWTGQGHIWLTLTYAIIYGMLIIQKLYETFHYNLMKLSSFVRLPETLNVFLILCQLV